MIGYAVDNGRKVWASGTESWNEALHHAPDAILPETPPFGPAHEKRRAANRSCQPRSLEHSQGVTGLPDDHIMEFIS